MNSNHHTKSPLMVARMMWFGFTASIGSFIFVVFSSTQGKEAQPEQVMTLGPVFGVMALVLVASMPFVRKATSGVQTLPLLMNDSDAEHWDTDLPAEAAQALLAQAHAKYRTSLIVGMALCEAAVLFGFATAFMSIMPIVILPFAGLGLAGLAWQFPTETGVHAIAKALRKDQENAGG